MAISKPHKPRSLATRLILGSALWIGGALVVGGVILATLFEDHIQRLFDDRQGVMLDSLIVVTRIGADGKIQLVRPPGQPEFERPLSGWYWQITSGRDAQLRSRSLWDQSLAQPERRESGSTRRYDVRGPQDERLRVLERDIALPGSDRIFRYAVAVDYREVAGLTEPFVVTLAWSLGVLGLGLIVGVFAQVRFGLRPLAHMRSALSDIRSGRADRLEGDFPTEVTPLADEINLLLDHIVQVVERARTHVGNLAHALKTPLAVLANEAGARSDPLASTVRRQTEAMRRRVEHYLSRAQTAATAGVPGIRVDPMPVIEDLARTLRRIQRFGEVEIVVLSAADGAAFRGDRQDFEEMVGNLMENACKWAASRVEVSVDKDGRDLRIAIEDDGPGLPADRRAQALARGGRLDETVQGSGLGLAIVQEIAALYGGSFELEDSGLGGLRAVLRLPATIVSAARAAAE